MVSLNDVSKEVLLLDCRASGGGDNFDAILGVHEATTKLWADVKHGKDRQEIEKRISNILIGGLVAARRMGITDIESVIQERLSELKSGAE